MCSYFVVGGWFVWKPGHLVNVTVTVLAVKGDVATKNVTTVTGFLFLLPHPFTALAGTCDDIFLYFGSVCCQLLIMPSALGRGRNVCVPVSGPQLQLLLSARWRLIVGEQRQKGLKVYVSASCHRLDTRDARGRRRVGGLYSEFKHHSLKAAHTALLLSIFFGS